MTAFRQFFRRAPPPPKPNTKQLLGQRRRTKEAPEKEGYTSLYIQAWFGVEREREREWVSYEPYIKQCPTFHAVPSTMKIYVKKKANMFTLIATILAIVLPLWVTLSSVSCFLRKKCPPFCRFSFPFPTPVPTAIKHSTKIGAQTIIHNAAGYSFFPWPVTAFSFPTLNTS